MALITLAGRTLLYPPVRGDMFTLLYELCLFAFFWTILIHRWLYREPNLKGVEGQISVPGCPSCGNDLPIEEEACPSCGQEVHTLRWIRIRSSGLAVFPFWILAIVSAFLAGQSLLAFITGAAGLVMAYSYRVLILPSGEGDR